MFEPRDGAEVFNSQTHKRFVQGDIVASAKFAACEQAIESMVGKSAPNFPQEPLTWTTLHGEVVILDFWAEWCGPCHNAMPELSQLYEKRADNGLAIVGIHLSGSELSVVVTAEQIINDRTIQVRWILVNPIPMATPLTLFADSSPCKNGLQIGDTQ